MPPANGGDSHVVIQHSVELKEKQIYGQRSEVKVNVNNSQL